MVSCLAIVVTSWLFSLFPSWAPCMGLRNFTCGHWMRETLSWRAPNQCDGMGALRAGSQFSATWRKPRIKWTQPWDIIWVAGFSLCLGWPLFFLDTSDNNLPFVLKFLWCHVSLTCKQKRSDRCNFLSFLFCEISYLLGLLWGSNELILHQSFVSIK